MKGQDQDIKKPKNKNKTKNLLHNSLIFLPFIFSYLLSWKIFIQQYQVCRDLGKGLEMLFLSQPLCVKAGLQIFWEKELQVFLNFESYVHFGKVGSKRLDKFICAPQIWVLFWTARLQSFHIFTIPKWVKKAY